MPTLNNVSRHVIDHLKKALEDERGDENESGFVVNWREVGEDERGSRGRNEAIADMMTSMERKQSRINFFREHETRKRSWVRIMGRTPYNVDGYVVSVDCRLVP